MASPLTDTTPILAVLGGGIVLLICSTLATVVWRRADVTIGAILWAGSSAAAHPERYVQPAKVATVRAISMVGAGLFLAGVLVLLVQGVWRLL